MSTFQSLDLIWNDPSDSRLFYRKYNWIVWLVLEVLSLRDEIAREMFATSKFGIGGH